MHGRLALLRLHSYSDWTNTREPLRMSSHQISQVAPTIFAESSKANVGMSQFPFVFGVQSQFCLVRSIVCVRACIEMSSTGLFWMLVPSWTYYFENCDNFMKGHWARGSMPLDVDSVRYSVHVSFCQAIYFLFGHDVNSSFLQYTWVSMSFCPKCVEPSGYGQSLVKL